MDLVVCKKKLHISFSPRVECSLTLTDDDGLEAIQHLDNCDGLWLWQMRKTRWLSLKTTRQCFAQKIFHDFDGRSIFITFWSSWWSIEMEEKINNNCSLKTETLTKSQFSKLLSWSVDMMGDAKRRRYQILDFSYLIFRGGASHSGIVYCTKPSCSSTQYQLPPMQLSGPSRVQQFAGYSPPGYSLQLKV